MKTPNAADGRLLHPLLPVCLLLGACAASAWSAVAAVPPSLVVLRPHQDHAYVIIDLENTVNTPVAIKRLLFSTSRDVSAPQREIDHSCQIQIRPRAQFQMCLEIERQPNNLEYYNTYVLEVTGQNGTVTETSFSYKVVQEWPWRGQRPMITWDKRPTNDPQIMVLELDEGYTAEVDPQPTTDITVSGVAEGNRFIVTVTPRCGPEVRFFERARINIRDPDGVTYQVAPFCCRLNPLPPATGPTAQP